MTTNLDTALLSFAELVRRYHDTGRPEDLAPVIESIEAAIGTGQRDLAGWYASIASVGLGCSVRIATATADRRPARVH